MRSIEAAAQKIESFIREIERQLGWVTQAVGQPADRAASVGLRLDAPSRPSWNWQLDRQGREQLRVLRLSVDDGQWRRPQPRTGLRRGDRPPSSFQPGRVPQGKRTVFTMAVANGSRDKATGVTVADVNLKFSSPTRSRRQGREGVAMPMSSTGRVAGWTP